MKRRKLNESGQRGWFIGNFPESAFRTDKFEVCYQKQDRRVMPSHYHKDLHEIMLVISGKMLLNGEIFTAGEIAVLEPGEINQMEYLEQTEVIGIKTPSIPEDKHYL